MDRGEIGGGMIDSVTLNSNFVVGNFNMYVARATSRERVTKESLSN